MFVNCGRSHRDDDNNEVANEDVLDTPVPDANLSLHRVHGILDRMSAGCPEKAAQEPQGSGDDHNEAVDAKAL